MIEVAATAATTTLLVDGDLDVAERDTFPEIKAQIAGLRHTRLVIDLCGVSFMDSTGAAFLISLAESSRQRGSETVLRGANERDLFVLEVCGVLDMFVIEPGCDHDDPPPEQDGPTPD